MREPVIKICKICKTPFRPNKYHPHQEVCSQPSCQAQRQLLNERQWRKKNKFYFRYKERKTPWQRFRAAYLSKWRKEHPNYFKTYRKKARKQKLDNFLETS